MTGLQPPPELLGARRKSLVALDILVIRRRVEISHPRNIDVSAAALDGRRGQLGQPDVEGVPAHGRCENQETNRLTTLAARHHRSLSILGAVFISRPMARARCTASWRLCAPSFWYRCRRWVLTVFAERKSSVAISGAPMWVGR